MENCILWSCTQAVNCSQPEGSLDRRTIGRLGQRFHKPHQVCRTLLQTIVIRKHTWATLEVVGTRIFNDEEEVNLEHQPLLVACCDTQGYVGGILPWRGHTPGRKRQYLGMRADLLHLYIRYEGKWTSRCSKWRDKPAGENRRQTRGRRTTNYSTVQLNPPVSSHVTKDLHRLPSGQWMQRDYHYLA